MHETRDVFLLHNNLLINQVLCTHIYRRRSLYSFLIQSLTPKTHSHIKHAISRITSFAVIIYTIVSSGVGNVSCIMHAFMLDIPHI